MSIFTDELSEKILGRSDTGLWIVEFEEGKPARFFANDVMDKLLGLPEELEPEERFRKHHICIHPDDLQMFEDYSDKLAVERTEIVYRYNHPVWGLRYVRCSGIRNTDEKRFFSFYGTHQDITNTIRLEKDKLHETMLAEENQELKHEQFYSENLYKNLMQIQTCGILAYRFPSHEIIIMNDMARKLYGIKDDEEVTATNYFECLKNLKYDNESETKEKLKLLKNGLGQVSFSMTITHEDGKKYRVWSITQRIQMENGDNIIISSLQDISLLTEAQELNLELEEQLDIIKAYGSIYDSSYYIDLKDGSFVELGHEIENVNELIGDNGNAQDKFETMLKHIVLPNSQDDMREFVDLSTINERLKGKRFISRQFECKYVDWAEGIFIPAKRDENGDLEHIIWATRDVSDVVIKEVKNQKELIKATKKAQIANKAKTAFLFNMSHDIRTPMNAIVGFTDLIEKNINDPERCIDYIGKIKNSSDFLLSLINNVLEMARIESGKVRLDESKVNMHNFVGAISPIFEQAMKDKNIKLSYDYDIKNDYIYCDSTKLREIFLNIISNAYKYTPEGGEVAISVKELQCDKEGFTTVETVIADTGIGMSKEYLPTLFEEFSRERNVTDSGIEGTGLGMPIVKKLVELMGGDIEVESELGKGTKFTVTITHRLADSEDMMVDDNFKYDKEKFKGKRVLIVEDNDLNAEISMEILNSAGFVTERAEDGVICIDMLNKAADDYYDLILMDIQMPNMNGYRATKYIRRMDNKNKSRIPIIAITANAFDVDKAAALEAGMDAHISKPIKVDVLMQTLGKLIIN